MVRWTMTVFAALAVCAGRAEAQVACEAMRTFTAPDVRITAATPSTTPVPHCKVDGVIGKEIRFSLWLPETWNGSFVMGGQGGFAGTIESHAMGMGALDKGYAVAGTDTGHIGPGGATDGRWALGNLERIVNFGHAAVHRVTETAKAAVRTRYGRTAEKAYFAGCSNGGRQALMSAQRYPDDFDAILAGAPALDFAGAIATFMTITRAIYPDPAQVRTPTLSTGDLQALRNAVMATCDAADGLTDGVLADPATCTFDPRAIACASGNQEGAFRRWRSRRSRRSPMGRCWMASRISSASRTAPRACRVAGGSSGWSGSPMRSVPGAPAWPMDSATTSSATS